MRLPEAATVPWGATHGATACATTLGLRTAGRNILRRTSVFSSFSVADKIGARNTDSMCPYSSWPIKVPSDTSTGGASHVGIAPGVMALVRSSISASFRLMLVLPLSWGATAGRKSLTICNSFTLGMVILLDMGLVL